MRFPPSFNRRSFTLFCGSAGVAAALGASLSETPELGPFRKLCAELTGFPPSALDPQLTARLLQTLVEEGRGPELTSRLQAPSPEFADLEAEIIAAWYSGVLPAPSGPVVGTFQGALIWAALGFATPLGVCGAPQDWTNPPSAPA